ncbi:MAG TPA: ABC transporter transmembrane domain-containing protein, partial [Candidatus Dormibacteraeota bacterium]|nr:ABC transporter transmembrane domain-containing protein [Candidatus Dormibacteraeota bacterium]
MTTTGDRAGPGTGIRYLWRRSGRLRLAAGLAVAGAGIDLARPWPLVLVVDNVVDRRPPGQPWATLLAPVGYSALGLALAAGLALMSLALAGALVSFLGSYLADASAEQIGGDLRADLHTRLLSLSLDFHDHQRAGELAARLTNDVSRVQEALAATVTNVLPHSVTLIGTALVLLAINPALALACLPVVTAGTLVVADMRQRLVVAHVEQRDRLGDTLARAVEVMRNVRLVQALAYKPGVERSFRARNLDVVRSGLRVAELTVRHEPTAGIIVAAGATLVLWIGAYAVLAGRMTVGVLVVVLWYVMALNVPARSLTWLTSVLGRGLASWERVAEIVGDDHETASEADQAPILPSPREAIVLRGVSFRYFPSQPVLNELDLRIP